MKKAGSSFIDEPALFIILISYLPFRENRICFDYTFYFITFLPLMIRIPLALAFTR